MRLIALLFVGLWSLQASAVSIHSLSVGYENINPLGSNALKYSEMLGASANIFIDTDWNRGKLQGVVSGQFLNLPLKNLSGFNLVMGGAYAGLRTHPDLIKQPSWISPTFGLLVGGIYAVLSVPAGGAVTLNSAFALATQAVPGFDVSVWREVGVQIAFPLTVIWGSTPMYLANQTISLRYEL